MGSDASSHDGRADEGAKGRVTQELDQLPTSNSQLPTPKDAGYPVDRRLQTVMPDDARIRPQASDLAPHPRFSDVLDAFDRDDVDRLRQLIREDPSLLSARTNLDPPVSLLHRRHAAASRRRESRPRRPSAACARGRHRAISCSRLAPTRTPRRSDPMAVRRWAWSSRASRRAIGTCLGRSWTCSSHTAHVST